jgi:hypothetical protein
MPSLRATGYRSPSPVDRPGIDRVGEGGLVQPLSPAFRAISPIRYWVAWPGPVVAVDARLRRGSAGYLQFCKTMISLAVPKPLETSHVEPIEET